MFFSAQEVLKRAVLFPGPVGVKVTQTAVCCSFT